MIGVNVRACDQNQDEPMQLALLLDRATQLTGRLEEYDRGERALVFHEELRRAKHSGDKDGDRNGEGSVSGDPCAHMSLLGLWMRRDCTRRRLSCDEGIILSCDEGKHSARVVR